MADGGIEDTDTAASASNLPDHPHFPHHYSQTQQQQATEELIAMEGEYKLNYNTLRPIGKGAFGFVRLAQKLDNKSLVCLHTSGNNICNIIQNTSAKNKLSSPSPLL